MSTMENLQLSLLNRTTRRRHAREAHRCAWQESPEAARCRAEYTGSPAVGLVFLGALGFWLGAAISVLWHWIF